MHGTRGLDERTRATVAGTREHFHDKTQKVARTVRTARKKVNKEARRDLE